MQTNLRAIFDGAKTYWSTPHQDAYENVLHKQFPASSQGGEPALACCQQPSQLCDATEHGWNREPWMSLGFTLAADSYRYAFLSHDIDNLSEFSAIAQGDPACNGSIETWRIDGSIAGNAVVEKMPLRAVPADSTGF